MYLIYPVILSEHVKTYYTYSQRIKQKYYMHCYMDTVSTCSFKENLKNRRFVLPEDKYLAERYPCLYL